MAKVKDDDVQGLSIADLITALRAAAGNDDESLKKRAEYEAEAHKRLNKRENETHPGISVYSHPEGDVAHPKAPLKCKMFWVGYPIESDTTTPAEIGWLNQAKPGEFQFTKTDGSTSTLTVTASAKGDGSLERMEFHFPCRGDNRHNLPSKISMLREVYGDGGEATELQRVRAERDELLKALELATAPSHA